MIGIVCGFALEAVHPNPGFWELPDFPQCLFASSTRGEGVQTRPPLIASEDVGCQGPT